MREIVFLKRNAEKWKQFELLLSSPKLEDPDTLADLFIELTDDLSYARTYYPGSETARYLNELTQKVHQAIYKNKKEDKSRFKTFWTMEIPLVVQKHHRELLISFSFFMIALLIGILSAANDPSFIRMILGDRYVDMTLQNIHKGDPMAVYKQMEALPMFLGITVNNIFVSFKAFASGIFFTIGTFYILFTNAVMLGAFQYLFYHHGILLQAMLTIWIHGTLEISSVIIAGAAGITMGKSILFPGTYSRIEAFQKGAIDGIKMVVGLVPIFMTAGFLESFVTRYSNMPVYLSLGIIILSATFIIYYFIIYPIKLRKRLLDERKN